MDHVSVSEIVVVEVIAVRATAASDAEPRIAWIEKTRAGQSVMLDGRQVGGPYDEVRVFDFLDGRLTWIGKTESKWVLGDVELPGSYSDISRPAATATGRVAAGVCHDKRCRLLLDRQEVGPEFEDVSLVAFSPDGTHYVYAGKRRKQWVALLTTCHGVASWSRGTQPFNSFFAGIVASFA